MPVPVAKVFAAAGEAVSSVIKKPPMLARGQLTFFQWQARADSAKAQRELGNPRRRSRPARRPAETL
jgi:hypothetical protein